MSHTVEQAKGITTQDQLYRKFRDCGEGVFSAKAREVSLAFFEQLEEVDDCASLLDCMGGILVHLKPFESSEARTPHHETQE